jgi:glycosyltransferase involved in cell wall biosynthesis
VEKLSILIKDASLREKMGREGRERVMERYTVQACAPRLFSIFQRLVARGITE